LPWISLVVVVIVLFNRGCDFARLTILIADRESLETFALFAVSTSCKTNL